MSMQENNNRRDNASHVLRIYVIIVTFNMLDGLNKTLSSLKSVAAKNINCDLNAIVVNGNPCDDGHIIANNYPDILYKYVAEKDLGIYDAMNKGIALLPDEGYTIFINSDDELLDIPVALHDSNYETLFFDVISHDVNSDLYEVFNVASKKSLSACNLLRPRLHHQGCFVKNATLKKYRYDLSVGIRADVLLMGTLLKYHSAAFFNDVVALITTGGKSDKYDLNNILSFFYIANNLGIGKFNTFILSFPEVVKYSLKGLMGQKGIYLVRKLKKSLRNYIK